VRLEIGPSVLLAARYELFDVPDVEALCTRAARTWATKTEARLSPEDFESLVAFLITAVWRMSLTYDSSHSSSFEAIVRGRLGNRCTDGLRQHRGRTRWQFSGSTHTREIPQPISLDAPTGERGDPLGASIGSGDGDPTAGDLADPCGGLLDDRDGEADWDLALCRALAARLLRERAQRSRAA
jgi:hypothetical protein